MIRKRTPWPRRFETAPRRLAQSHYVLLEEMNNPYAPGSAAHDAYNDEWQRLLGRDLKQQPERSPQP